MSVIDSLIAQLGFEFDDADLKKFDEGVKTATAALAGVVAGAAAAGAAIFAFTKQIAEANDHTGKFAQRVGLDVEALQELGYVAELNGGSIDSMNSSLANLNRTASEAAKGMGSNVETFGMLGVSVTDAKGQIKGTDQLLEDVADAISKLGTQAERLEFAQKLGIGEDLLLAIQNGSDAIRKQRKEARELGFVIDRDAAQAAADFNDNLLRLMKIVQGVSSAIATRLMKQMKPFVDLTIEWFKANKQIIQQNLSSFLNGVAKGIRVTFNVLARLWNIVDTLVAGFGGWKNAIVLATGAMVALNASTLLIPALIIAAGAAILLLIEDIIKFAEGGDSAIGNLVEGHHNLEAALNTLIHLAKMVGEGWNLMFTQGDEALEGFIMMAEDVYDAIVDFVLTPFEKAAQLAAKIKNFASGTIRVAGEVKDDIGEVLAGLGSTIATVSGPQAAYAGPSQSMMSNTNNNTKVNNTFNINGGNPAEVEATIKKVIHNEYRMAETNLTSPVDQ